MKGTRFRFWEPYTKRMTKSYSLYEVKSAHELCAQCFDHAMQYIKMKDKNGIDVCEGDLLICPSGDYHEVIYESYFACFNTKHLISGEVSDIAKDEILECFEIVGNIYENPEKL